MGGLRTIDLKIETVGRGFVERQLGATEQTLGRVGMGRMDRDAERQIHVQRVRAVVELGRLLLGKPGGDIDDRRHRVERQEHCETPFGQANHGCAGRHDLAQLTGIDIAELDRPLLAEGRADPIVGIEPGEQESGQLPAGFPLEEFRDELQAARVAVSGADSGGGAFIHAKSAIAREFDYRKSED